MSVLQPISYGLVHQIGPGTGARGFGSYKADNTETIRPYQQESASPIGRGYSMGIVSGAPTFYDPYAGQKEDPVVMLLRQLLKQKNPVENKPVDAGFKNNQQVYPPEGPAGNPEGRTLGEAPQTRIYPQIDVENQTQVMARERPMYMNLEDISTEQRGYLDVVVQRLADVLNAGAAGIIATSAFGARRMSEIGIPVTPSMAYDATVRQIEAAFRNYLPAGTSNTVISQSRAIIDLITNMDRYREDMIRLGERTMSDYVYQPIQIAANRGLGILVDQARTQLEYYGEVAPLTIADIVERVINFQTMGAMTMQAIILTVIAVLNPGRFRQEFQTIRNRGPGGGLRMAPPQRAITNIARF
jgi:hypothetical protein